MRKRTKSSAHTVTCPTVMHAVKKNKQGRMQGDPGAEGILMAGTRGASVRR